MGKSSARGSGERVVKASRIRQISKRNIRKRQWKLPKHCKSRHRWWRRMLTSTLMLHLQIMNVFMCLEILQYMAWTPHPPLVTVAYEGLTHKPGDVLLLWNTQDPIVGDVVAFELEHRGDYLTLHRVVEVQREEGEEGKNTVQNLFYDTRAEPMPGSKSRPLDEDPNNNNQFAQILMTREHLCGKVVFRIPLIGGIFIVVSAFPGLPYVVFLLGVWRRNRWMLWIGILSSITKFCYAA